jgi:adenylate cyclase
MGLTPVVLFSLMSVFGLFARPENRVYDLFLRFRQNRKPAQDITFLDIDDRAIAYNGAFPWSRPVIADGLLRLKEYGARAAVFGIDFFDAGDNDRYLIQASQLFGRSWVALNLRKSPLSGEYAERRVMAEKRFSYPITEAPETLKGQYADILPPLPDFALSAIGAGFNNVKADGDGIKRRIDLAQNIHGHWYLQLAFSPLIDYLGHPSIELDKSRMYLRDAKMPNGTVKDIKIPLDGRNRLLLDRPKTNYSGSYNHISFADFSLMEELEFKLERNMQTLGNAETVLFSRLDLPLARIPLIIMDLKKLFDTIHAARDEALKNCSDESFRTYVDCRRISRGLMREILNIDLNVILTELEPGNARAIREETAYISLLTEQIRIDLDRYEGLNEKIENAVYNKFCILNRADTGTADSIHGVVMDMILYGSFITPAGIDLRTLITLIIVILVLFVSRSFSKAARASLGLITVIAIIAITALLFRFTGIFFNPFVPVLSVIAAVFIKEISSAFRRLLPRRLDDQRRRNGYSHYPQDRIRRQGS